MPKPEPLKVAIVHDCYLYEGGAERVLQALMESFPQADVYIPLIAGEFAQKISQTHRLFASPYNWPLFHGQWASFLKPLILNYFENLDLSAYSIVISSSHSFGSKAVKTGKKTKHIAYIHTPPRYLYSEYNEMGWLKKFPWSILSWPLLTYLRKKDCQAAQRPNLLLANSQNVQKRIKKYYHRTSLVVYPPIDVSIKKISTRKLAGKYYLFHSRLVKQKGAELVIKTFNANQKPLVIVGVGVEENKLKKIAKANIKFLGFVPDKKLEQIYARAKALVYCALDEDFGLVPAEALARGVPIIAYNSGGVKETVINGLTGVLFDRYSTKSLSQAIKIFEQTKFNSKLLQQQTKNSVKCYLQKK